MNLHLRWTIILSEVIMINLASMDSQNFIPCYNVSCYLQGQPSIKHFTNICFGEFFMYLYWNLLPNDIKYIALRNYSSFLNVWPNPSNTLQYQFNSKDMYSILAHRDVKTLDYIITSHNALCDALEEGNMVGGVVHKYKKYI